MSNIITLHPVNKLSVGQKFTPTTTDRPREFTVLAASEKFPAGEGTYAVWVVLYQNEGNAYHPFAVHNATDRPEGWSLTNGEYCLTLTEAVNVYSKRSGQEA